MVLSKKKKTTNIFCRHKHEKKSMLEPISVFSDCGIFHITTCYSRSSFDRDLCKFLTEKNEFFSIKRNPTKHFEHLILEKK